jgi:hypothetical protein
LGLALPDALGFGLALGLGLGLALGLGFGVGIAAINAATTMTALAMRFMTGSVP